VIVVRDKTERPEGVAANVARLAGRKRADIVRHVSELIDNQAAYRAMAAGANPYGDGAASQKIAEDIIRAE